MESSWDRGGKNRGIRNQIPGVPASLFSSYFLPSLPHRFHEIWDTGKCMYRIPACVLLQKYLFFHIKSAADENSGTENIFLSFWQTIFSIVFRSCHRCTKIKKKKEFNSRPRLNCSWAPIRQNTNTPLWFASLWWCGGSVSTGVNNPIF